MLHNLLFLIYAKNLIYNLDSNIYSDNYISYIRMIFNNDSIDNYICETVKCESTKYIKMNDFINYVSKNFDIKKYEDELIYLEGLSDEQLKKLIDVIFKKEYTQILKFYEKTRDLFILHTILSKYDDIILTDFSKKLEKNFILCDFKNKSNYFMKIFNSYTYLCKNKTLYNKDEFSTAIKEKLQYIENQKNTFKFNIFEINKKKFFIRNYISIVIFLNYSKNKNIYLTDIFIFLFEFYIKEFKKMKLFLNDYILKIDKNFITSMHNFIVKKNYSSLYNFNVKKSDSNIKYFLNLVNFLINILIEDIDFLFYKESFISNIKNFILNLELIEKFLKENILKIEKGNFTNLNMQTEFFKSVFNEKKFSIDFNFDLKNYIQNKKNKNLIKYFNKFKGEKIFEILCEIYFSHVLNFSELFEAKHKITIKNFIKFMQIFN